VLRARLATAAVAIPLLLALVFFAPAWLFAAVIAVLTALAIWEYAGLAFAGQPRDRAVMLVFGGVLVAAAVSGRPAAVIAALSLVTALGLAWTVLGRADFERGLLDVGLMLVGLLYVGLLLPHFIWLHALEDGPRWVTFVIAVVMAGDTGGYFVGRAWGRHRLTPRLSPGKTVEGAVGIVASGVAIAAVANLLLLRGRSFGEVLALAFVMTVVGQFGDLGESVIKRSFGAKESGRLFPGHGGILDRIDSLLFPVTLVYYYLHGLE
jgi:phosphatidate cytidylyltransferase